MTRSRPFDYRRGMALQPQRPPRVLRGRGRRVARGGPSRQPPWRRLRPGVVARHVGFAGLDPRPSRQGGNRGHRRDRPSHPGLRPVPDHLDERLAKVSQLAPRVTRVDVVVTHERTTRQVRVRRADLSRTGSIVRAEACDEDKYVAVDAAVEKLLERLRRASGKRRSAIRGGRDVAAPVGVGDLVATADAVFQRSRSTDAPDGRFGAGRRLPHRGAREGARQCADDPGRGPQPDGARRARLLPVQRQRVRPAERGVPTPGVVLRRHPPRAGGRSADNPATSCGKHGIGPLVPFGGRRQAC